MTMQNEMAAAERRKRRQTAGKILIIISIAILALGMIFVCRLPDKWENSYINKQKELAKEALEKGYVCYEAKDLRSIGSERGFYVWIATMESGDRFAILIIDDPDKVYCDGMHASSIDVFVREDSGEIRDIDGDEMTLYTDCYATLDYIGQGAALGGCIMSIFLGIVIWLVFLVLFVTGVLLAVLNKKKSI
ncbi:MAG: hypothetical protein J6K58_08180 [Lachnospiraceae bacterium]|nr:hypothetical protein [Lachnospiraceae bacterium]